MLKIKLFKWFAGLVLAFGAMSALLGIWMIGQRVVEEAQTRVRYDLSSAWAVYESQLKTVETIVKLTAARSVLQEAAAEQKWNDPNSAQYLRGLLAQVCNDFHLDFLALVGPDGKVVLRCQAPFRTGDYRNDEPLVAKALSGVAGSGTVLLPKELLDAEADGLVDRAFLAIQETAHARPSPRATEDRGMAMMAAAPVEKNGKVIGALYAGQLLNRNQAFVDRIEDIVFGQDNYRGKASGSVTVFLADTRVATTVRMPNGNRAIGTRVSAEVAERVLDNATRWADRAFVVSDWYLTAYDPIRDDRGAVIGMMYVGILEQPYSDLRQAMFIRYCALVAVALLGVLLLAMWMAGRIARPLHRLATAAKKMQHGGPFEPVTPDRNCNETAGLIEAFNGMARALSQRESQLQEANARMAAANESLRALNAHYMETLQFVSHELNSPLSSITNYTYTMRQRLLGDLTEKQEKALDVIGANLKRILEMIRHYLNLARIESGEVHPVPTRVALRADVLSPILASLETELHARSLRVEDRVDPHLNLHSDLNMTREVFENLLSNAVKFGRAGGLITLSSRVEGGWARCCVRNEGEGIAPEKQGELFRKFSRLEPAGPHAAGRGTGLGLFICKKIMESHGGTISVESQVGQWAEFCCTFPLEAPAGASEPPHDEAAAAP